MMRSSKPSVSRFRPPHSPPRANFESRLVRGVEFVQMSPRKTEDMGSAPFGTIEHILAKHPKLYGGFKF